MMMMIGVGILNTQFDTFFFWQNGKNKKQKERRIELFVKNHNNKPDMYSFQLKDGLAGRYDTLMISILKEDNKK